MHLLLKKDLTPLKTQKLAQIDADANRASESYRTAGEHAAAVYALKRAELNAFDAGRPINELIMLQAESETLEMPVESILASWRSKIVIEDSRLPKIEANRLKLKRQIRNAVTQDEIENIMASAVWE